MEASQDCMTYTPMDKHMLNQMRFSAACGVCSSLLRKLQMTQEAPFVESVHQAIVGLARSLNNTKTGDCTALSQCQ